MRIHYSYEALARLAQYELEVFEHFDEVLEPESHSEFGHTGFLVLVGPQDEATLAAIVAAHRALGLRTSVLSHDEQATLESRIAHADVGAPAWEPRAGYADPHGVVAGFASVARRHGVALHTWALAQSLADLPALFRRRGHPRPGPASERVELEVDDHNAAKDQEGAEQQARVNRLAQYERAQGDMLSLLWG